MWAHLRFGNIESICCVQKMFIFIIFPSISLVPFYSDVWHYWKQVSESRIHMQVRNKGSVYRYVYKHIILKKGCAQISCDMLVAPAARQSAATFDVLDSVTRTGALMMDGMSQRHVGGSDTRKRRFSSCRNHRLGNLPVSPAWITLAWTCGF